MNIRPALRVLAALATASLLATPARAQSGAGPRDQVVSANPFGLLIEWFNAEYERTSGESFTIGVGGSTFSIDGDRYTNVDAFWRFYPQEHPEPVRAWSFGVKAGLTAIDSRTYFGAGFDLNYSWLQGKNDNFYIGTGFGLKRLWGHDEGIKIVPTFRFVNIGVAF